MSTGDAGNPLIDALDRGSRDVRGILARALDGAEVSVAEADVLATTTGRDLAALTLTADELRRGHVGDTLTELKGAGLGTLPGTSAEILDQAIRDRIARGRITVDQWVEVITTAHALGIRTTSTIMYGHVETPAHWVQHMALLRSIQKDTGGFTEFVPLSLIHSEAPMYSKALVEGVRPGATGVEVIRMHALARVLLGPVLRNIQASWVKEGPKLAQALLDAGANDLGGTLINESISTSAGATYGQLVGPAELRRWIRG